VVQQDPEDENWMGCWC